MSKLLALLACGLRQRELAADSEPDLLIGHAPLDDAVAARPARTVILAG
ncbi:hypothetical protein ACIBI0_20780 [Microbispora rosea]